ncbi:MAG: methylated-DNA--[Lentisphaeria bacterium]|nr:methylated-DNA--[protein]-cysteine S-methyltransferase [Lentisphaeria bacterium]MBR3688189.1 methylated-DNA--[protein]-cysteine S-methyltransferase [Lentisphaeria bacterium]
MDYVYHYQSPLGGITLTSDGAALVGLWFDKQRFFADSVVQDHEEKSLPVFEQADRWLDLYFSGRDPGFAPPVTLRTTEFRQAVCRIMLTIPYGCTMTYGRIAEIVARQRGVPRMSAQAVGGAVGHNPVSLIIPCHRVIGAGSALVGYGGGLDRKAALLELEHADLSGDFIP